MGLKTPFWMSFGLLDIIILWMNLSNILVKLAEEAEETTTSDVADTAFWQNLWDEITSFFQNDALGWAFRIVIAIVVLIVGIYLIKFIGYLVKKSLSKERKRKNKPSYKMESSVVTFVCSALKFVLAIVLALGVMAILTIDVSGVVSIISSAFLAVGLGMQDIITNFADGVILLSEKNIRSGDYIKVGDGLCEGTVRKISIMKTTIVTPDGITNIIPNTTMCTEVIANYSTSEIRRLALYFPFEYGIDVDERCRLIEDIIAEVPGVYYDDDHRASTNIDNFSQERMNVITIRLLFYVRNADYWTVKSESQRAFYKKFVELGIKCAPYDKEYYVPTSD